MDAAGVIERGSHAAFSLFRPKVDRLTNTPLSHLMDLQAGHVRARDSSYVGKTNEVDAMIRATKDQRRRWPGLWYELLQGAWDYNNWEKGPPAIQVYYEKSESPVSFYEFIADRKKISIGRKRKVERIEVVNHIKAGTGLRPRHIALTEHDEQGTGSETLGLHGRGLSIATTAAMAGGMAEKVSFCSYTEDIGAWYGEAQLVTDDVDPTFPPSLQLRYKNERALPLDQTTISVHTPNEDLLEALQELPNWFLPTNPQYRFQRLDPANQNIMPNRLTVFANGASIEKKYYDEKFDNLDFLGHRGLEKVKSVEPVRVEVIPQDILPHAEPINFVYVDGLKVEVPDGRFTHVWSFWGFSKGTKDGYNPRRSNDSLKLNGGIRNLIGETLARCANSDVFLDILTQVADSGARYEGDVASSSMHDLDRHDGAKKALVAAWDQYKQRHNIAEPIHITINHDAKRRADKENRPVVYIRSSALAGRLLAHVPDLKKIDDVFEEEAVAERARHREEMEAKEKELQEARTKQMIAEAQSKQLIAAEQERAKREKGIAGEAKATGEVLKIAVPEHWRDGAQIAQLHLLHALGMDKGFVESTTADGGIVLSLADRVFERIPTNSRQLESVGHFVENFLVVFGDYVSVDVRVLKKGKGVYFKFSKDLDIDQDRNATIRVQRGTMDLGNDSFVKIDLTPNDKYLSLVRAGTLDSLGEAYQQFLRTTVSNVEGLLDKDGHIDLRKYLDSPLAKEYPPIVALIRARRQLEEAREQTLRDLEAVNRQRKRAGLPPLHVESGEANAPVVLTPARRQIIREGGRGERVETRIIEDLPRSAGSISLQSPDSNLGLSIHGDNREEEVIEIADPARLLEREVDKIFEGRVSPDFSLRSGQWGKTRGYLLSHLSQEFSGLSMEDYVLLPNIKHGKKHEYATLTFHKAITDIQSAQALYIPPGFEPVGYWHPDRDIQLHISGIPEKHVYAMYVAEGQIPAGLEMYYQPIRLPDRSPPVDNEMGDIVDLTDLNVHWRDLVTSLREANMNEKQKMDIIIQAWTKGFSYLNRQTTFNQFSRAVPKLFNAQIINTAEGDCGYCMRGLTGLVRSANIPSRERASYLSSDGEFNQFKNYHGLVEVFLNGQWVLVEPQLGYLESGYTVGEIPEAYRQQFENLLAAIPAKRSLSTRLLAALEERIAVPKEEGDELPALFDDEAQTFVKKTQQSRLVRMQDLHGRIIDGVDKSAGNLEVSPATIPAIVDMMTIGPSDRRRDDLVRRLTEETYRRGGSFALTRDNIAEVLLALTEGEGNTSRELAGFPMLLPAQSEGVPILTTPTDLEVKNLEKQLSLFHAQLALVEQGASDTAALRNAQRKIQDLKEYIEFLKAELRVKNRIGTREQKHLRRQKRLDAFKRIGRITAYSALAQQLYVNVIAPRLSELNISQVHAAEISEGVREIGQEMPEVVIHIPTIVTQILSSPGATEAASKATEFATHVIEAIHDTGEYIAGLPPEGVIPAVLLGAASFYAGRKFEARRMKKKEQKE